MRSARNRTNGHYQEKGINVLKIILDLTLEEAQTIRTALAVLTKQNEFSKCFKWNNATRERWLSSFIGICYRLEGLKHDSKQA